MKIVFFMVPTLKHGGGAEKYFINIANEMAKRGHEISIVNLNMSFYKKLTFLLSIYYVSKLTAIRYSDAEIEANLKNVKWLKISLKNLRRTLQNFDIVYSKNEILELGILKLAGFKKFPPVIVGVHTPIYYPIVSSMQSKFHNFLYLGPLYNWLLKDCAGIHISNSDDKYFIKKHFSGLKIKIFKIFYPFDHDTFKSLEIKRRDNKFRILFVGRLNEQKGVDILVKVIERLSSISIFRDLHFTIAGSGEFGNLLNQLQSKFPNVIWLGHIPQNKMPELYSSNDMMVVPSRRECLPYTCLEAQSCGLPVIASDIPGPRDIIIDGETGFLVSNKIEEFVDKINCFYYLKRDNHKKFEEFGIKAREHIPEKFEPTKIYKRLEKMFEEVTSNAK